MNEVASLKSILRSSICLVSKGENSVLQMSAGTIRIAAITVSVSIQELPLFLVFFVIVTKDGLDETAKNVCCDVMVLSLPQFSTLCLINSKNILNSVTLSIKLD